jgi:hypothetical protein
MQATSTANKVAALSNNNHGSAQSVADIYRAYIDDDSIDPLIDSCIASMDYMVPLRAAKRSEKYKYDHETMALLAKACDKTIRDHVDNRHKQKLDLRVLEREKVSIDNFKAQKDLIATRQACVTAMLKDTTVGKDKEAVYSICGVDSTPAKPDPAPKKQTVLGQNKGGDAGKVTVAPAPKASPRQGVTSAPAQ